MRKNTRAGQRPGDDPGRVQPGNDPVGQATSEIGGVWDLLVVGGGTAGIIGAKTAAGLGARVLLVERARTGGDCLWTGCVPSKALLAAAAAAAGVREAGRFGVRAASVGVDFGAVMDHVRGVIATIAPVDSPAALHRAGVHVVSGTATFTGRSSADVDGHRVRFSQALLATGASPDLPPIPGLDHAGALTTDTVWDLNTLPERLTVLGGGSVGCELAQAFGRLGSSVTLLEAEQQILPGEDPAAGAVVRRALEAEGVRVLTGSPVVAVRTGAGPSGAGAVHMRDEQVIVHDLLLVALGRRPRTSDLGLDAAGVALSQDGAVQVDANLRTSNARIWAAGDLTGHPPYTHLAGVHASLAAGNAVLGLRRSVDNRAVPRVTFTDPEVAAVGAPTSRDKLGALRVVTFEHEYVDRAVADDANAGFTRLVVDRKGRVKGATIVGPRAGESLSELTLAVRHGLTTKDLASATHPYPTYSDGVWNAAIADAQHRLRAPAPAAAITGLAALRRVWLAVQQLRRR